VYPLDKRCQIWFRNSPHTDKEKLTDKANTPSGRRLEVHERGETEAAALDRMKVNVVDPAGGLARQA